MAVGPNRWGVIYNPKAGSRKAQKRWKEIRDYMESQHVQFDYVQSEGFGSVERLACTLANNGYRTIIVVGGDGAINDAVNGILESEAENKHEIAFGIIPNGIGNDFAKYCAPKAEEKQLKPGAKLSVLIFLLGIICVVFYASAISPAVGLINPVVVPRDAAIWSFMFLIASLITVFCKVDVSKIGSSSVFQSGMIACICVFGVAWLGDTFVRFHTNEIKELAAGTVSAYPALLAVVFFIAAMLLYSQAATAKAITPAIVAALGITTANPGDSYMLVASFAAVSALFVLPTYPTLLGAVQMDYTGTTRIGKWVFNHAFFLPGLLGIVFSVALGFLAVSVF